MSAWEYYLSITAIADNDRECEWQDFLNDGILVFVGLPQAIQNVSRSSY